MKTNLTKILIDEYGKTKEELGYRLHCDAKTVERWYRGFRVPMPVHQDKLQKLLEREQRKNKSISGV